MRRIEHAIEVARSPKPKQRSRKLKQRLQLRLLLHQLPYQSLLSLLCLVVLLLRVRLSLDYHRTNAAVATSSRVDCILQHPLLHLHRSLHRRTQVFDIADEDDYGEHDEVLRRIRG